MYSPAFFLMVDLAEPEKILPITGRDAQKVVELLMSPNLGREVLTEGQPFKIIPYTDLQEAIRRMGYGALAIDINLQKPLRMICNAISAVTLIGSNTPGEAKMIAIALGASS